MLGANCKSASTASSAHRLVKGANDSSAAAAFSVSALSINGLGVDPSTIDLVGSAPPPSCLAELGDIKSGCGTLNPEILASYVREKLRAFVITHNGGGGGQSGEQPSGGNAQESAAADSASAAAAEVPRPRCNCDDPNCHVEMCYQVL